MCLGQESSVDLRAPLRASQDDVLLHAVIDQAMLLKPARHHFAIRDGRAPILSRHMSVTGG
jgi:cyclic pyranopterin phosphate synthase